MSQRRPTHLQRVARVLEWRGQTSELDWRGATIDNGPQINRLASRIAELRAAGWVIDSRERRHGLALYRLLSKPPVASPVPTGAAGPDPDPLFTPAPQSAVLLGVDE